jgi:IS30 family transposase
MVEEKLQRRWSPQQIAGWLKLAFPTSPEMQVSHETIYRTLFVQSRGALRRELTRYLRTGRVIRRPKGVRMPDGRGGRPNILHISERPAEAEDRAVPGHWEGDLVFGKNMSPVATLAGRSTRFVMLVALPSGNHQADIVADALTAAITTLPEQLAKTLTWDQGHEMADHQRFTMQTGVQVYFCDPKSPWQRGSNEKRQRAAAPVPASPARLPHPHPGRPRRHRPRAQRTPSTNPRLQDTITSTSRGVALTA